MIRIVLHFIFGVYWLPVSQKGNLKTPRARFGAATKDGNIFVVGGVKGFKTSDELSSMEMYNPAQDEWAIVEPPMKVIKGPVRATIVNDVWFDIYFLFLLSVTLCAL